MSKKKVKKKNKPVAAAKKKSSKPKKATTKQSFSFSRPSNKRPDDSLHRSIFYWSLAVMALIVFFLAFQSGVNGDDEFQNDYSTKLVDFYTTLGADTAALYVEKGNMHYYGGLFDLATGLINRAMGWTDYDRAYHQVRHLFNGGFGLLALLFIGWIAQVLIGWRGAVLALLFGFLSPRFLGHSLMNPKDIPFAAGFAIAIYYLILLLKTLPKPNWKHAVGVAVGFGIALGTRAGGLLIVGYVCLFMGLDFLLRFGWKGLSRQTTALTNYLIYGIGIILGGYILGILPWPAALVDPLGHPFAALTEFSELGIKIRVLFGGENVMSDATVWHYPLTWMLFTIPIFIWLGLVVHMIWGGQIFKRYAPLPYFLLVFATVFPLVYIIYKDSILHDGWRHLIFVYPSLVVIAAMGWVFLEEKLKHQRVGTYAVWIMLTLALLEPSIFILRNNKVPYVYFNPLVGGINGAFGYYETDYWGVSVKPAIDWMEEQGIVGPNMTDTVVIGTHFYYSVDRLTRKEYKGKVRTKYVRFNQRYTEDWDYGIFPSRYFRGYHLQAGTWPNSKAVHIVTANGVPLAAVEKNSSKAPYLGEAAIKKKDWPSAAEHFHQEIAQHPDNELSWLGLSNAYLNLGQYEKSLEAAQKSLAIAPNSENGLYFSGLAQMRMGEGSAATKSFTDLLEVNDKFYIANYYLAMIYQQNQQPDQAIEQVLQAIESNPRFKAGYQLAAQLYASIGDNQRATAYEQTAAKL